MRWSASCFLLVVACGGGSTEDAGASGSSSGSTSTGAGTGDTTVAETETDGTGPSEDLPGDACQPCEGDECPAGQKCTVWGKPDDVAAEAMCVSASGNRQPGETCTATGEPLGVTGPDDCAPGSVCFFQDDETGEGMCVEYCQGCGELSCPGGVPCRPDIGPGPFAVCPDPCNPTAGTNECASSDFTCQGPPEDFFQCRRILADNAGLQGDECGNSFDCAYGFACWQTEVLESCAFAACCTKICDLNEPDPCSGAEVCTPFTDDPLPSWAHVGYCLLP